MKERIKKRNTTNNKAKEKKKKKQTKYEDMNDVCNSAAYYRVYILVSKATKRNRQSQHQHQR